MLVGNPAATLAARGATLLEAGPNLGRFLAAVVAVIITVVVLYRFMVRLNGRGAHLDKGGNGAP